LALMSRGAQDLTLRQAVHAWEAAQVIRGQTQGQAQKCSARKMLRINV
jgi:hypothetical protein